MDMRKYKLLSRRPYQELSSIYHLSPLYGYQSNRAGTVTTMIGSLEVDRREPHEHVPTIKVLKSSGTIQEWLQDSPTYILSREAIVSALQPFVPTGRTLHLGDYHVSLINSRLVVLGPDSKKAKEAEDRLAGLLQTLDGCRLVGRAMRVRGQDMLDVAKSEICLNLGLPSPVRKEPDYSWAPLPGRELDYDDDHHAIRAFRLPGICDRTITELHGMCAAIVSDGKVDDNEIRLLTKFLREKNEFIDAWPISELYDLAKKILEDGKVTDEERDALRRFLESIAADPEKCGQAADSIFDPNPGITFKKKVFLVTGRLALCQRKEAWAMIEQRGGFVVNSPSKKVDYLVVGDLGTDAWQFSRYGRKIEAIVENKRAGAQTLIVTEKEFVRALEAAK